MDEILKTQAEDESDEFGVHVDDLTEGSSASSTGTDVVDGASTNAVNTDVGTSDLDNRRVDAATSDAGQDPGPDPGTTDASTDSGSGHTSTDSGPTTTGADVLEASSTAEITQLGPVEGEVLPEQTIVGPPDFVLKDPNLLPTWEDMVDGWDAAAAGRPPAGPQSEAFWVGWRGFVEANQVTGPVADVAPPASEPLETQEEKILEFLHGHKHDPHIETPTEHPPQVMPGPGVK